ncbi:MAG TPA: ADOP family duplicated permease, partial [Gemmatimonadaceae bacterium]|nr:ADOP family duplicated permease [Gemmatimonadaceae bacterium]
MDTLRQDLSFALRTLRRDAAFALVAVFTLAVGIGAATVMFGVLRAVLLRPLPVREQERVLVMWGANARLDRTRVPIGGEAYRRYARESRALAGAAAVEYHGATEWVVRQDAAVERLRGALVSGNYFRVLGTRAGLGRTLEAADDVRGASPVLVISDRLWRRRYGGDPGAVGRQVEIVLTGRRFTIVGVMPPGVEYPRGADIWVPFATYLPPAMDSLSDRFLNVYLVGRLSRGATEERARAELASLLRGERSPFPPDFRAGMTAVATTLPALVLGDARRALWALAAAVAVLLLVACANVAGLLLVRGLARRGELAVRAAIGASSARIVRQLVTESAVLALAGGAAGVLLAVWSVDVLRALAPAGLPRADELRIDLPVLGAALLATLGSALLFGALPALAAARSEPAAALRGGARLAAGATARARHALVVAQIALSVLVLAAAGLLVRSVDKLQRAELGFSAERVTVAQLTYPWARLGADPLAQLLPLLDDAVRRAGAVPGVIAASLTAVPPLAPSDSWVAMVSPERSDAARSEDAPSAAMQPISPGFFRTIGASLVRGRDFGERDDAGGGPVVIVSDALARRLWPGESSLGKRVKLGEPGSAEPWRTVVGVARETRYRDVTNSRPTVYLPVRQFTAVPWYLLVGSSADSTVLLPALRRALAEVDPGLVLAGATPMRELLDVPLARPRFDAALLATFAAIVLALSAVGVYGAMAAFVRQRRHEIGVRMAVGARGGDVRRLVLARGLRLAALGTALGLAASAGALRLLGALLYEVSPLDAGTLAGAALGMLAVAALACALPAWA